MSIRWEKRPLTGRYSCAGIPINLTQVYLTALVSPMAVLMRAPPTKLIISRNQRKASTRCWGVRVSITTAAGSQMARQT